MQCRHDCLSCHFNVGQNISSLWLLVTFCCHSLCMSVCWQTIASLLYLQKYLCTNVAVLQGQKQSSMKSQPYKTVLRIIHIMITSLTSVAKAYTVPTPKITKERWVSSVSSCTVEIKGMIVLYVGLWINVKASVMAKRFAVKIISDMTYLVSTGTLNLNSNNHHKWSKLQVTIDLKMCI